MTQTTSPNHVEHDPVQKKFYIALPAGECVLNYRIVDEKTLDYYHTFVPPILRGHGLAAIIVQHALDYAKDNGFEVIPSCPYVKSYLEAHRKKKP